MPDVATIDRTETITVADRFCGPPRIGNGGNIAGRLAAYVPGSVEVTLRRPAPLATPLAVERMSSDEVELVHEGAVLASAKQTLLALDVPRPPSSDEARAAASKFPGFTYHTFTNCFVCGPARHKHDGLRIFSGPTAEGDVVAAPWTPDSSLASPAGGIDTAFVWAALDCPGYFAAGFVRETALLGRFAAEVDRAPGIGESTIVIGWPLGRDGRKAHAGTALVGEDGDVLARAKATWITI